MRGNGKIMPMHSGNTFIDIRDSLRNPGSLDFAMDFTRNLYVPQRGALITDLTKLPGYTMTRAGIKSRIGSNGQFYTAAANAPLITNEGYWAEGAYTNLMPRSGPTVAQLSASGNTSNVSAAGGDPLALAWLVLDNSSTVAFAYQAVTPIASTVYAASALVETTDGSQPIAGTNSVTGDFGLLVGGNFLTSATFGYQRLGATNIWRVTATGTTVASTNSSTGVIRYAGMSTRPLKFSGFQLVAGTLPGPIIVTTGSAATVANDKMLLAQPIPIDEDWVTWVVANFDHPSGTTERLWCLSDGSTSERILIERAATGALDGLVYTGGSLLTGLSCGVNQTTAGRCVVVLRRRAGKYSVSAKSGGTVGIGTEVAAAYPASLNRLDVGQYLGVAQANSPVEGIFYKRGTFSDADLTALLGAA